jgi:hypothetical protein
MTADHRALLGSLIGPLLITKIARLAPASAKIVCRKITLSCIPPITQQYFTFDHVGSRFCRLYRSGRRRLEGKKLGKRSNVAKCREILIDKIKRLVLGNRNA